MQTPNNGGMPMQPQQQQTQQVNPQQMLTNQLAQMQAPYQQPMQYTQPQAPSLDGVGVLVPVKIPYVTGTVKVMIQVPAALMNNPVAVQQAIQQVLANPQAFHHLFQTIEASGLQVDAWQKKQYGGGGGGYGGGGYGGGGGGGYNRGGGRGWG